MIRLDIQPYCGECWCFEASVSQGQKTIAFDGTVVRSDTIVRCEHAKRCENIRRYLEQQLRSELQKNSTNSNNEED